MDTARRGPGLQAPNRDFDVAHIEQVEGGIDAFIQARDKQRRKQEGERRQAELWVESTRAYNRKRRAEIREAWCTHHEEQAARLRATLEDLIEYHEERAEELQPKGAA